MRPNKDRRTEIILYGLLLIPLLFTAAALAQATEQAQGLAEITAVLSEILHTPSMLRWCASTPKFLLAVLVLYPLAVYCYMLDQADRHPGAEHGTAKWGSAHRLNIKYRNTKDSKENYILTENVRFSTDSHAHKHNLNIIVIGGSGSGKTRFYVKPNALQLIGSYLFLDPKGELTRTLGRIMETKGISVTVLDLVHFQGHYNPMAYLETDEDAIKLAFAIVNNTKPKDAPSGGDKFWDDSSVLLISALILYLMYEAPASEQNFSTLMYMILNCQVSENEMVENPLMMLFGELERRDPQHPAVLQFKSFMLGAKKTLQSILISAAANLYMFNSRKFAEMTSRDEMFLPRMGLEQRALFIVLPDNDTTFNFIATMLYTQLFDQLFRLADSTPEYNGALPVHVRLMMDEFANVALPKNFKNILAVCRSRNISCDIILQNIAQLKSLFKDDWEGIIGNCDTLLYLGGNEYGTYEYLSKILGKETERTKSQSIGKGSRGSSSDSLQTAGRELCIGYALVVLFFAISLCKNTMNFHELKRPEAAIHYFLRFVAAKALVGYGMDIMLNVFSICNGIVTDMADSMGGISEAMVSLPAEMQTAIENVGFLASIPLWLVTILGSLFITVLSFVMILTVYGRFFRLYMYTALAPLPLAAFAGESTQSVGISFLKSYVGVCLEGAVIVLACVIYSAFVGTPTVTGGEATTIVWSYLAETVFNMLVLVGLIKGSDRIIHEMMGL